MIDKTQVSRHFGKMSKSYDQYAIIQKKMAHTLQAFAQKSGSFKNILEIGCGTGYFTRLLAEMYPNAQITATDISPSMLSVAQENLLSFNNITYAVADGENLTATGTFDLIISNAAFQWFNNYSQAFQQFYNRLTPGGYLIYATFGSHTFKELHTAFQAARKQLSITQGAHGPKFISAEELAEITTKLGFISKHQQEYQQEHFPSVKDFLTSIKKVGANNATTSNNIVINRNLMLSMLKYYEETFNINNQVYATYHIIYSCNQKK